MIICGIDEAGRGPLAGPVVAAAVVFENDFRIEEVNDSKVLKESERERLFFKIIDNCLDYRISLINNIEIDNTNILRATMKAMHLAIAHLNLRPDKYLIDGNYFKLPDNYEKDLDYETIVGGDAKVFEISCASILAKVTRDNIMRGYHIRYPEYNFHKHKGYPTKEHYALIKLHGLCEIHRKSFLKNIISELNSSG
ncbi:MAG: ribonuclease HII [Ignavibacteria bacterium]|nr:ribonuclease HII [Ignavibacteria bacterium]